MFSVHSNFILAKDEARGKTQAYLGKDTWGGQIYWSLRNWEDVWEEVNPNSNKLSWKFMNPKKIHLDKIYIKVTKVLNNGREAKRKWKIEIDGEQADVTLDDNYEAEIKGKGFKNDHLRVSRIELKFTEITLLFTSQQNCTSVDLNTFLLEGLL